MLVRCFAAAAAVLSMSLAAHASDIDFNTLSGTNGDSFSSYTENGFTVTNTAGQYLVGTIFGNPIPDLFSGTADQVIYPASTGSASVTITATNGGAFTFASADLAASEEGETFSYNGSLNGLADFSQTGSITDIFAVFSTYASSAPAVDLTSLTITETGGDFNLDNIMVTAVPTAVTPEPSSLLLLGTGLLGVVGAARRRLLA